APLTGLHEVPVNRRLNSRMFREHAAIEREEGSDRMERGVVRAGGSAVEITICKEQPGATKRVNCAVPLGSAILRRHAMSPSAFAFRYNGYLATSYATTSTGLALMGRSNSRTKSYSASM